MLSKLLTIIALAAPLTTLAEEQKPGFLFVHGALFNAAGWSTVQRLLKEDGYDSFAIDMPGRNQDGIVFESVTLHSATEKVCGFLAKHKDRRFILVGHSQGGAVITQANDACGETVAKLIYVAAVLPLNGETAFASLDPSEDQAFAKCATFDEKSKAFVVNRSGPLEASFFQDLRQTNPELADFAVASMVNEPAGIGTSEASISNAKLFSTERYYIETTEDRIISVATQRKIQAKGRMQGAPAGIPLVYSLKAGHSPFLSKPKELSARLSLLAQY